MAAAGFSRVVITLGHMAHLFRASIGRGQRFGLRIDYCVEEEPHGTAGPIRLVRDLEEDFLVMNGDLLADIDFSDLFQKHQQRRAWGTIALHRREVNIDYGVVEADDAGLLQEYREKPTIPYEVSMGINVLSRRCVEFIPPSARFDMPSLMLAMRRAGKVVSCYRTDCYWQDIGRFDDYQQASHDFVADPARFLRPPRTLPLRRCA